MAEALGEKAAARRYAADDARAVQRFRKTFLGTDGLLPARYRDMQTPAAFLLLLDLLPEGNGRQHGDQTEFRAWVEKDFKRRLDAAIRQLGYKSSAAWFRRVAELTIRTAAKRKEEKRGM